MELATSVKKAISIHHKKIYVYCKKFVHNSIHLQVNDTKEIVENNVLKYRICAEVIVRTLMMMELVDFVFKVTILLEAYAIHINENNLDFINITKKINKYV